MNEIEIVEPTELAISQRDQLEAMAQAADAAAQSTVFTRDLEKLAPRTSEAYADDLRTWHGFILSADPEFGDCDWMTDQDCWATVTYGLVDAFVQWMKREVSLSARSTASLPACASSARWPSRLE